MLKPDLSKAVAGQVSWWLWVTASVCWRKSTILGLVVEQYSNRNYLLHRKLKLKCQRSTPWSGHGTPPVWHSSISRGRNGESESLKYNVCNWNNHNLDKKYIWRVRRPRSAKLCGSSRSTITYCRSNPRMKIRTASPTRFDHLSQFLTIWIWQWPIPVHSWALLRPLHISASEDQKYVQIQKHVSSPSPRSRFSMRAMVSRSLVSS